MIITIVGAGNSGCANAFIAAENGHEVRILKTTRGTAHDEHFGKMQKNGGLWGIDNTKSDKYTDFADEGEKTLPQSNCAHGGNVCIKTDDGLLRQISSR